ncbi:hypothetical protein CP973_30130 [Streptomyces albofaciens JCM 4342]|uniref:hypothetical protein n=1 Tax=Streptomyces albofaciens TaxID=66866 RepID=UPI00123C79F6|nr:hypothetical protein [Streptomyces albofaciens]KAA6213484.1 hypothetical protein CP973_30130 [Streptomyces albofaciens JCM 4342]
MSEALLSHAVGAVKRARRTAGRVRRRVERINTVPVLGTRGQPRAALRPVHLSVLGGRTLNIAVPCPADHTAPDAALLVLEHRGLRRTVAMEAEPQPDGTTLLTATASLRHARHDPGLDGVRLDDGVWRLSVAVRDASGTRRTLGVSAAEPYAANGPTLPHPPSTTSGTVFRPVRSVDGYAMIKVSGPREQAELDTFDLRWDRVTVRGRLLAARGPKDQYRAEAVRRGSGATVPVDITWDGDHFTFDVPLAAMAGGTRAQRVWDIQLRRGRNRIKICRRLTDVRHPRKVFRVPFRTIAVEDGTLLRVHAHLSATGAFAVNCTAFTTTEESA